MNNSSYTWGRNLLRVKAESESPKPETETRPKSETPAETETLAETSETGRNVRNPGRNCPKLAETSETPAETIRNYLKPSESLKFKAEMLDSFE